jgi:putative SOS response-associated peptidase YedK
MCGKFTQMSSWAEVHTWSRLLDAEEIAVGGGDGGNEGPQMVTPMRFAWVITRGEDGARQTLPMRWGFIDRWSKTPLNRPRHMHARAETIDRLPSFAAAFAHRRGLVCVRSFNVGQDVGSRTIQHVLTSRDALPLAIAVVWEQVQGPDGEPLLTFVMVTTPPSGLVGQVTDRMPAIVSPEHWATWLGETDAPAEEVKALLVPYPRALDMVLQPKAPAARRAAKG